MNTLITLGSTLSKEEADLLEWYMFSRLSKDIEKKKQARRLLNRIAASSIKDEELEEWFDKAGIEGFICYGLFETIIDMRIDAINRDSCIRIGGGKEKSSLPNFMND
ncbi:TPA: hypothetical protein P0E36_005237 [Vibrio harveyi]|nr:hypothetical protein [Vibrio harveyi]